MSTIASAITSANNIYITTTTSSATGMTTSAQWFAHPGGVTAASQPVSLCFVDESGGSNHLLKGASYRLPDGALIEIDPLGNYKILDQDAKVTYEACRIRGFNRFLNASELIEQFIGDLALSGAKQRNVLKIPIEAFINWLIVKAAAADGEPPPRRRYNLRCMYCKRFLPRRLIAQGVNFCSAAHLDRHLRALPAPGVVSAA